MMVGVWIVIGVLVVVVVVGILLYNGIVRSNVRVDEAWSDITVQLKRRSDLIPNIVNTVKGYAAHESSVFEKVTEARTRIMGAHTVGETAQAENQFQQALKSLFAVTENYPQLRASENFQQLQSELIDTEDKIQASRRFYNATARDLNTSIKTFPGNIIAGMTGVKAREFFEVDEGQRALIEKPTDVKF